MYCVEHVEHSRSLLSGDKVLLCVLPPTPKFNYTRVAMLVSCVFIALTIIVYVWLHEKLNLFSKTLISYCVSLFLMYANLAYVQFNKDIGKSACTGIGKTLFLFSRYSSYLIAVATLFMHFEWSRLTRYRHPLVKCNVFKFLNSNLNYLAKLYNSR